MSFDLEGHWWLILGLLLAIFTAAFTWALRGDTTALSVRKVLRVLLIWPVLLDKDRQLTQSSGLRLAVLAIVMLIIGALAILLTPGKFSP